MASSSASPQAAGVEVTAAPPSIHKRTYQACVSIAALFPNASSENDCRDIRSSGLSRIMAQMRWAFERDGWRCSFCFI